MKHYMCPSFQFGAKNGSPLPGIVSFEGKGYYRVVPVGQLSFDCRPYCRLSRRMQGKKTFSFTVDQFICKTIRSHDSRIQKHMCKI